MSTLTVLMKAFDFDLLDNFCREYPYRVHIDVVNSCEAWSFIINRSAFHIFDENLRAVVMNFYTSWTEIIDFGWRYYSPNGHPDYYTFHGLKGDAFSNNELESVYNKMTEMRQHLYPKLKTMADYIQDNYPLDLDALALTFFKN